MRSQSSVEPKADSASSRREQLILALDVDSLDEALALSRSLRAYFALAKVGLELFSSAGPDAVRALRDEGFSVFVDLKLHDIPTTVARAARALGRSGVAFATFHATGGLEMGRAAVEGLLAGASDVGVRAPIALGVTVLTSEGDVTSELLAARVGTVVGSGAGGLVCAATDLSLVKSHAPGLVTVVPGTRPKGSPVNDQARTATPAEALSAGADLLVIGRAVTHAPDPKAAAEALFAA